MCDHAGSHIVTSTTNSTWHSSLYSSTFVPGRYILLLILVRNHKSKGIISSIHCTPLHLEVTTNQHCTVGNNTVLKGIGKHTPFGDQSVELKVDDYTILLLLCHYYYLCCRINRCILKHGLGRVAINIWYITPIMF